MAFEAQKQTIQKLENEIISLKETLVSATGSAEVMAVDDSETVETTATYESFDDEPSIECNDLSTQTDFTPTMSFESFDELNTIRLDCPAQARFLILQQKEELKAKTIEETLATKMRWKEQFESLAELKINLINFKAQDDQTEVISDEKTSNSIDKYMYGPGYDPFYCKRCQDVSSQTDISTLLIGLDFEDGIPSDDFQSQIRKLNGALVKLNYNQLKYTAETNRFRQYCDDLNAGKEITVFESDFPQEVTIKKKLSELVTSMNDQKDKVMQYIAFFKEKYPSVIIKSEAAIQFVESIDLSDSKDINVAVRYEIMQTMSKRLNVIQSNFSNMIISFGNRKVTLEQLHKLFSKVSNQKQAILGPYSYLVDVYKADFDYAVSIQLPKVSNKMVAEVIEREYENAKTIHLRFNLILSKFNGMSKKKIEKIKLKTSSVACKKKSILKNGDSGIPSSNQILSQHRETSDKETSTDDSLINQDESTDKMAKEMQLVHSEIFAQLESKVKSTLNFEIDAAIKKSTESFKNLQVPSTHCDKAELQQTKQRLKERESTLNQLDHELLLLRNEKNRFQAELCERDNTIAEEKKKAKKSKAEVNLLKSQNGNYKSEISKLQKKVENQHNSNHLQQITMKAKCKELERLKDEAKKYSSQQTSQAEVNKLKTKIRQGFELMPDF